MKYEDVLGVDSATSKDGVRVHAGQIWKNRRGKPDSVFLVLEVVERCYADGNIRDRVTGALSTEYDLQQRRGMDVESLRLMFPHLMFEPEKPERVEDK